MEQQQQEQQAAESLEQMLPPSSSTNVVNVVLFYKYFLPSKCPTIYNLHKEYYLEEIYSFLRNLCGGSNGPNDDDDDDGLGFKGRILLATEGINGTLSTNNTNLMKEFIRRMENFNLLTDIPKPPSPPGGSSSTIPSSPSPLSSSDDIDEENEINNKGYIFRNIDWKQSSTSTSSYDDGVIVEPFPDLKISKVKEIVSTGGLIHVQDMDTGSDGAASNDNSNLMHCIHSSYMLQALVAAHHDFVVPEPKEFLNFATKGGADCIGRTDIGILAEGMAADLFAININKLEYVGARHDPESLIAKLGIGTSVDLTIINGKIVWRNGELIGLDEDKLVADASAHVERVIYK